MSVNLQNPFPGMNPWLESRWQSVHARCLTYLCDQIDEQLPNGLAAVTEERIVVEHLGDGSTKEMRPDVLVSESWDAPPPSLPSPAWQDGEKREAMGLAEPDIVVLDKPVERCIQIVDAGGSPVTVVEALSPWNKLSKEGRASYFQKQRTYQEGGVNLVEIDLLRSGGRVFCADHPDFHQHGRFPYGVCVWRARVNDKAEVFALSVRSRLPRFAVPLRESDDDVALDLQAAVNRAFERGRYALMIRYEYPPVPPLSEEDAEWARGVLAERGYEVG